MKAINHLKLSKGAGVGLLVVPEFYSYIHCNEISGFIKHKLILKGRNIFVAGSNKSSFFRPEFNSRVIVLHLDFKNDKL